MRPALEPLEALQARSYQLLAQLTAVKSMLLLRRAQLDMAVATPALAHAAQCIATELAEATDPAKAAANAVTGVPISGQPFQPRPDPLVAADLTPWLLRRLTLACAMAAELRLATARALVVLK